MTDHVMTLIYFTAMSALVEYAVNCSKMSLKGKSSRKLANGQNIYDYENKIDSTDSSVPILGIYPRSQVSVYMTIVPLVQYTYVLENLSVENPRERGVIGS